MLFSEFKWQNQNEKIKQIIHLNKLENWLLIWLRNTKMEFLNVFYRAVKIECKVRIADLCKKGFH